MISCIMVAGLTILKSKTFVDTETKEIDGELSFGAKTFEDGVEVFTNNKY